LLAGSSHEELAAKVAGKLKVGLGQVLRETFPDGEIGIQIQEDVRGKDVFLLQSLALRPNHYLMELLIMADALKRSSARSISAVVPYFAYSRQDRMDKVHSPITARLVANLLEKAGLSRILTMDLHTQQLQGFFDIPVDHLTARSLFIKTFKDLGMEELVVVAPDLGAVKLARKFAEEMHVDLAIIDKRRLDATRVAVDAFVGDVKAKNVVLVDDMCSTGETLKSAARACKERGAKSVIAVVTHGLFVSESGFKASGIDRIFVTDTIATSHKPDVEITVVESAGAFAQAIGHIIEKELYEA
jgi:ribose-phosphate pyrophosphokinase